MSRARLAALLVCLLLVAALLLTACGNSDPYVGSKLSMMFHKPSCPWAAQIHDKDKVTFKTRDAAIKAGFQPDTTCNP